MDNIIFMDKVMNKLESTLTLARKIVAQGGMPPSDGVLDLAKALLEANQRISQLERAIEFVLTENEEAPWFEDVHAIYANTKEVSSHE